LDPNFVDVSQVPLIEYDGACMNAVSTVLNYLSGILDNVRIDSP
jgi:hypothetical protein